MTDEVTNDSLFLYRCLGCECVTILNIGHPQGECKCGREFYPVQRSITLGEPMTLEQVCGEALGPIAMGDQLADLNESVTELRDKWLRAVADLESYRQGGAPAAEASAPGDWTKLGTRSNSSPKYNEVVTVVEELIRQSAHDLIHGRADSVARTIVSNLAFKHGIGPMNRTDG